MAQKITRDRIFLLTTGEMAKKDQFIIAFAPENQSPRDDMCCVYNKKCYCGAFLVATIKELLNAKDFICLPFDDLVSRLDDMTATINSFVAAKLRDINYSPARVATQHKHKENQCTFCCRSFMTHTELQIHKKHQLHSMAPRVLHFDGAIL